MSECQKPPEIRELDKEKIDNLRKSMPGRNFIEVGPQRYIIPEGYRELASTFFNYEVRPSDVWLFGFMRSGTTLTQEIVWVIENDLDYDKAAKKVMDHRFPLIDYVFLMNDGEFVNSIGKSNANQDVKEIVKQYEVPHWKQLLETKERRFIKSHMPLSLMNPKIFTSGCKVIFCARNPKDGAVSTYMLMKLFGKGTSITLEEFWKSFQDNSRLYTPWFEYVKEGWDRRNDENFLFLFYEDTMKDKRKTILKIANFLGKKLTDEQVDRLEEHVSVSNFKKNKSVNNDHMADIGLSKTTDEVSFIRKGKAGGWRDYFSPELAAEADKWIEENEKKYGFKVPK